MLQFIKDCAEGFRNSYYYPGVLFFIFFVGICATVILLVQKKRGYALLAFLGTFLVAFVFPYLIGALILVITIPVICAVVFILSITHTFDE